MPVVARREADQRAHTGFYQLERAVLGTNLGPEFQFSAVTGLPVFIEIENHRYNAVIRSCVAVQVCFVKRTFRIDREVSLKLEES